MKRLLTILILLIGYSSYSQSIIKVTGTAGSIVGNNDPDSLGGQPSSYYAKDTGVIHKSGTETITGSKTVLNNLTIGSGNTKIYFNSSTGTIQTGTAIPQTGIISINDSLSGAGYPSGYHAFEDKSNVNISGAAGYASFDAFPTIEGANKIGHIVGFQSRPTFNGSDSITNYLESINARSYNNGTGAINSVKGIHIYDIGGTGPVGSNYGLYIDNISRGTTSNYSIFSNGGQAWFKDKLFTGTVTTTPTRQFTVFGSTDLKDTLMITKTTGTASATFQKLIYSNSLLAGGSIDFGTSTATFNKIESVFDAVNKSSLRFYTNNTGMTERVRITPSGGLLINKTVDSTFKLDVGGTSNFDGKASYSFNPTMTSADGNTITNKTYVDSSRNKARDSVQTNLALKVNISDTALMLTSYARTYMAANSIRGNNTGSAANAVDLTIAQTKAMLAPSYAMVTGSDVTTTLNSMSDVTGLSIAVAANKVYRITCVLLTACDNTGGLGFQFTGPAGAAIKGGCIVGSNTSSTALAIQRLLDFGSNNTSYNRFAGSSAITITGYMTTSSTAGNVVVQFRSVTAGQTSTIAIGSSFDLIEVK